MKKRKIKTLKQSPKDFAIVTKTQKSNDIMMYIQGFFIICSYIMIIIS
jgi:hypothetical protein